MCVCVSISFVCGHHTISLIALHVPDLELERGSIRQRDGVAHERCAHGDLAVFVKLAPDIAQDDARLANALCTRGCVAAFGVFSNGARTESPKSTSLTRGIVPGMVVCDPPAAVGMAGLGAASG